MLVAGDGQGFDELPVVALHERWNMEFAVSLVAEIEARLSALLPVTDTAKLKKLPLADNVARAQHPYRSGVVQQVTSVRLQRHERGANLIISHAEKYNLARSVFDPVIDKLTNLSSTKFYQKIELWEELIAETMSGVQPDATETDVPSDGTTLPDDDSGDDSDDITLIDPAECLETTELMNAMEWGDTTAMSEHQLMKQRYWTMEQQYLMTEQPYSQNILDVTTKNQFEASDSDMSSGIEGDSVGMTTLAGVDFVELKRGDEPPNDQRMVDDVNMPHYIEGKPRQQKRQGWASYAFMQRYVTVTYTRGLTINVVELTHWARHTRKIKTVLDILNQYPVIMEDMVLMVAHPTVKEVPSVLAAGYEKSFVVPEVTVTALQAAIHEF
ncbi:hypothetical protein BBJ28_00021806 [Nothophytophthora sp. Chile5]|nr:hypothetical protein BBJ28_00021806 [Nothophytophthora sp. Chile5]